MDNIFYNKQRIKIIGVGLIILILLKFYPQLITFASERPKTLYKLEWCVIVISAFFIYLMKQIGFHLEQLKNTVHPKRDVAIKICTYVFLICITGLCVMGYIWENRDNSPVYYDMRSTTEKGINVFLIIIDALRADHLNAYGYERDTAPHLEDFAREGVLFENCFVPATWTKPSVASIMTSLYPLMHGALFHGDALSDEVVTISEIMQKEGFITYGYVANPNLKKIFNFHQGFDFYDDFAMKDKMYLAQFRNIPFIQSLLPYFTEKRFDFADRDNIIIANKSILPWLERLKEQNFFAYLHYMDPHDPYSPPASYRKLYAYDQNNDNQKDISLYDGEIRFADTHLHKLFQSLKQLGIYDKSLIIITSDHGEEFKDHGHNFHGKTLYQEVARVPLIVKFPNHDFQGLKIHKQVSTLDILPTVLDFIRIPAEKYKFEGSSLIPLIKNRNLDLHPYLYFDENYDGVYILKGVIKDNQWKYIKTYKTGFGGVDPEELFNLVEDPFEKNNLIGTNDQILNDLKGILNEYRKYCEENKLIAPKTQLDNETLKQLKALGYL